MRKRSAVATTPAAADPRQTSIPGTEPSPPPSPPSGGVPVHVSVTDGIVFVKCPDCGLNQSVDSAVMKDMPDGKKLLHCCRCNGLVDPDEEITPALIAKLKAEYKSDPVQAAVAGVPEAAATMPPPQPGVDYSKVQTEEPMSDVIKRLAVCGYDVPLTVFCAWEPALRKQLAEFSKIGGPVLDQLQVLAKYQAKSPAPAASDVRTPVGSPSPRGGGAGDSPRSTTVEIGKLPAPAFVEHNETVTVCYGEEKFSPRQYNNFTVGPFFRTTNVRSGETPTQAAQRAYEELRGFADVEFKQKAKDYLTRLDWLIAEDRKRGGAVS